MQSRWVHLKPKALSMRRKGMAIRMVEKELHIPRSTLSGWFKNIKLSIRHQKRLEKDGRLALVKARKKAVLWHNEQKAKRIAEAIRKAKQTLLLLDSNRNEILELALAMLYLGEGAKKTVGTVMGNSDPRILRFFIYVLHKVYQVPLENIKCELHLRADQNPVELKRYWSKILKVPFANFGSISIDQRTKGKPTYNHYKGVCVVRCSRVAIQRKLMYIANTFCDRNAGALLSTRSSVG